MTKTTAQMIEVMQAFQEGKLIQSKRNPNCNEGVSEGDWIDNVAPTWNWVQRDYRVSPSQQSKPISDGGHAFPIHPDAHQSSVTLRDYFAAFALNGMLASNPAIPKGITKDNVDELMAREAYRTADAMIAERNK